MISLERLSTMSSERLEAILARSTIDYVRAMEETHRILDRLRLAPESELRREYGTLKEGFELKDLKVSQEEIDEAKRQLSPDLLAALKIAAENIEKFHRSQLERPTWFTEIEPGLLAGRTTRPLNRAGVYVPGGRASYPSSALMNVIPAKVAGVRVITAATPPGPGFKARAEILAALDLAGATEIFKLGGAWAVGCLAYGLGGIERVDKIVGPGSLWVTAAKMAVFGQVDIDMPAGPSEGFIVCDESADSSCLVWDFLAQLEHDPQAAAILVSSCEKKAAEVAEGVNKELVAIERREIIEKSLNNSAIIFVDSLDKALELANLYAPEHLELVVADPLSLLGRVCNAGSIFLGPYAPIAAGDYASGPNHVLPTGGGARAFSGLSVDSFLKKITFQRLSPEALARLAPAAATLARAEGLPAHARSLEVRFKS